MSTNVHSVLILPGSTFKLYCKDGLSPLDVNHIESVFNFGGTVKAVDCGMANQLVAFHQMWADMSE